MRLLSDAELAQILDKEIFHKISDAADSLGLECYVVGGYVRDLFLERPSNDIDVVVVGSGIKVADALRRSLGRKAHISVFRNFGTAQVKYKGTEVDEQILVRLCSKNTLKTEIGKQANISFFYPSHIHLLLKRLTEL